MCRERRQRLAQHVYESTYRRPRALERQGTPVYQEAYTFMSELNPILLVVVFWVILGATAFYMFRVWLKIPTEAEIEAAHEAETHGGEKVTSGKASH